MFDTPMVVLSLDGVQHAYPSWVSPDNCVLYYHTVPSPDIQVLTRSPP
jgi:hypothetical protein